MVALPNTKTDNGLMIISRVERHLKAAATNQSANLRIQFDKNTMSLGHYAAFIEFSLYVRHTKRN